MPKERKQRDACGNVRFAVQLGPDGLIDRKSSEMKVQPIRPRLHQILGTRPTVGTLMELCESNYQLLLRLAPALASLRGRHLSQRAKAADLHLQVLEQTAYTSLVRLTHYFVDDGHCEPDAELRIYHDARQVEVVNLRQSALPMERLYDHPGLEQKWKANQFVARWLLFCLSQGHLFAGEENSDDDASATVEPVFA